MIRTTLPKRQGCHGFSGAVRMVDSLLEEIDLRTARSVSIWAKLGSSPENQGAVGWFAVSPISRLGDLQVDEVAHEARVAEEGDDEPLELATGLRDCGDDDEFAPLACEAACRSVQR
ncbi:MULTISPECIES: hypothetical protein [Actinoalloteichus]|uniref:Uncharacterized protein n=1 Tax=Actinoalloteichus fjordicus TaxID=1612552 RepID=A0AAC9LFH7_9PSEU|nr:MULTISPECIES: hypothetical protein [Actinoalloteichus]APU16421.1 hypothetical protein UA74_22015 [Actinoalloteichus fjordicus]APU22479.1 hypothetical protein UA75_22485 [Actinoalloteichus sp. GBA129-24]